MINLCGKCGSTDFFGNQTQVRCAVCGGFFCRLPEYVGRLLTGK